VGQGHGHGHGSAGDDRRRLGLALGVTFLVAVVGAVGAIVTGSLALLADLGHVGTDVVALATALIASALAVRPPSRRRTFGLGRAEVLGAAVNAVLLLGVTAWVAIEAVERIASPTEVPGGGLLFYGVVGLVGNLVSLVVLQRGSGGMNVRGAALHVLGDALGSVAVLAAAVVTLTTGWAYADTAASLVIVAILLPRTVSLLRETGHVLLEGAPAGIDVDDVHAALLSVEGVAEVHDLHVWAINDRSPALSAHLVISDDGCATADCGEHGVLDRASQVLRDRFGLHHSTLQIEAVEHADHEEACTPLPAAPPSVPSEAVRKP
jgi:cobalt-zinc-cadmium efflux system protein